MEHKLKLFLLLVFAGISSLGMAQKSVSGTVLDDQNQPLPGVAVTVPGTTKGTVTDLDGHYSLTLDEEDGNLTFSFIGFKNQTLPVNGSTVDANMEPDAIDLNEVVAVGYGTQKKKLLTGATLQMKGDDLAKMNTTNALSAMQSAAPGVQITQSSAQPGKGFKVNIRGMGTIGESSPLLIIDGVQSGTADDGLNGLNPNDIESIDVLKDAASAAIYGARAANGVILVTTKQGKAGKLTVQYDGYVGWSNAYKVPACLNAQDYITIINECNFNDKGELPHWSEIVPASILERVQNGWEGTDWFKEYENKNACQTSHALTLTGGSERSKFAIGVNYSENNGVMGGDNASDYRRYGGRINSDHIVIKVKDYDLLTIGENLSFWYHSSHDLPESNGYWNIMQSAYTASPLVEAYDSNGNLTSYANNSGGYSDDIYSQPLNGFMNGMYSSLNRSRDFGVGATFFWELQPIKGLKYRGQLNTGYSGSTYRAEQKPYSVSSTNANSNYSVSQSQSASSSLTFDNTISYAIPEFAKNNIDIMIGQSIERSNWSSNMSISTSTSENNANALILNGWDYALISNFTQDDVTGFSGTETPTQGSIASFFGRLNYNFAERIMLSATLRADASSNFAEGHRWGYFPSVSAGWVMTSEDFMAGATSVLSYFKIRASWGQNGNCNIDNFYYLSNVGFSPTEYANYGYAFGSSYDSRVNGTYTSGAYARNVPNEDVTWETSEQINIGFDSRFLNSRLGLIFDWYQKKTKDWLVQAPLNDVLGYEEAAYINAGDVKNTGVEIGLSWNDHVSDNFSYNIGVNFAWNKNEVTKLGTASGKIGDDKSSELFQNSSYVTLVEEGHPISYFSGMSYSGVWQNYDQIEKARAEGKAVLADAQPGDLIWDDYNGDGQITYDEDRHEIGKPTPSYTLGVNIGFDFFGVDLGIAGYGAFDQQIMQCYRTAQLGNQYGNYTVDVFDRWHGEGTSNSQPRLSSSSTNEQWISERYMQNAGFFKISNITLGYDFCHIWHGNFFQTLRLYVQGQNLYTFTKYTGVDPECGANGGTDANWARGIDVGLYPTARTYIVGLSFKF